MNMNIGELVDMLENNFQNHNKIYIKVDGKLRDIEFIEYLNCDGSGDVMDDDVVIDLDEKG